MPLVSVWFGVTHFPTIFLVGVIIVIYTSPLLGFSIYFSSAFMFLYLLIHLYRLEEVRLRVSALVFLFILMIFGAVFSLLKEKMSPIIFSSYTALSFFSAYTLCKRPSEVSSVALLSFFYLVVWFLFMGFQNGTSKGATNEYLYGASGNYVPFLFFVACSLYYSSKIYSGLKYSILPVLVMVVCSFVVGGRSGIAVSLLFLMIVFFDTARTSNFRSFGSYFFLFCGFFFVLIVFFIFSDEFYFFLSGVFEGTKYGGSGIESVRWAINKEYVTGMDFRGFIFGRNLEDIALIRMVGGNPHNSIIEGHSHLGFAFILGLLFMVLYPLLNIFLRFSPEKLFVYAIFMILLMRGFVDSAFFYGVFDYVLIYLFLLASFPKETLNARLRGEKT